jgi:hypothetical protein
LFIAAPTNGQRELTPPRLHGGNRKEVSDFGRGGGGQGGCQRKISVELQEVTIVMGRNVKVIRKSLKIPTEEKMRKCDRHETQCLNFTF